LSEAGIAHASGVAVGDFQLRGDQVPVHLASSQN
jgi:hypothetical protein